MNSSNPAIIKIMEEKCEALGGLEQGGGYLPQDLSWWNI